MGNATRYGELAVDSRNANSIRPTRIADHWDRRSWTTTDGAGMRWFTDTPTRRHSANIELVIVDPSRGDAVDSCDPELWQSSGDTQKYVLELSQFEDGFVQVTEALQRLSGIVAIHLVTSGDGRSMRLGRSRLDDQSIRAHAGDLACWNQALSSRAQFVVHGCGLHSTAAGRELLESIATLCDCDVIEFADKKVREVAIDGVELVDVGELGPEAAAGCGSTLVNASMASEVAHQGQCATLDRGASGPARSTKVPTSTLRVLRQLAFFSEDLYLSGDGLAQWRAEVFVGADDCHDESPGMSKPNLGNAIFLASRTGGCDAFAAVHVDVCPQIDLQVSAAVVPERRPRSSNLAVVPSGAKISGLGNARRRSEGRIVSRKEQIWAAPFVECPVGMEADEIGHRVRMNLLAFPSVSESLVVEFIQDRSLAGVCGSEIVSNSTECDSGLCATWFGAGTVTPDRDSTSQCQLGHVCTTTLVTPSIAESTDDCRNESRWSSARSTEFGWRLRLESAAGYPLLYVERVPIAQKLPSPDFDCRLVHASCEIASATFTIDTNSDRNQTAETGVLAVLRQAKIVIASVPDGLRREPLVVAGGNCVAAEIVSSESVVGRTLVVGFDHVGLEMGRNPMDDRSRCIVPSRPLGDWREIDTLIGC